MSVILEASFADKKKHKIKRNISLFEKESAPRKDMRALVLPSCPNTEIEELVNVGFDPVKIYGVEKDPTKFQILMDHYKDLVHVYQDDVFEFMDTSRAAESYSYFHCDLCGFLTEDAAKNLQSWLKIMASNSRVRVTTFGSRRGIGQLNFEEYVQQEILHRLCRVGYDIDQHDDNRWHEFYVALQDFTEDSTLTIISLMMMNFFFGVNNFEDYIIQCRMTGDFLPVANGKSFIQNINRWTYSGEETNNFMYTIWADLVPIPKDALRNSNQWILDQIADILTQIVYQIPPFPNYDLPERDKNNG